jgi:fructosamine-3-kinase
MSRRDIYYWKCDRPAAFHGTAERGAADPSLKNELKNALGDFFGEKPIALRPAASQGNHLTWLAGIGGRDLFIRVENGPEGDGHLAIESAVLDRVRAVGVPTPIVFGCDASRSRVPFAWQALERIPSPDLNHWYKLGALDWRRIAPLIGAAVAKWQGILPRGFGPFEGEFVGYHERYADYFFLRLEEHLDFLTRREFLSIGESSEICAEIAAHSELLDLSESCLVHKDLALWNVLGTEREIAAFIDFDDAVGGDPMDDLSLLACFHGREFLAVALAGYAEERPLPPDYQRRFWLHLLRNLIVKAVIRVGAGYFERDGAFFLIGAGNSGADLRRFTRERIALARRGLDSGAPLNLLPET